MNYSNRTMSGRVPFTGKMRTSIKTLRKASGWGATAVLNALARFSPDNGKSFKTGAVNSLLYSESLKTVDPALYDAVIAVLEQAAAQPETQDTYQKSRSHAELPRAFAEELDMALASSALSVDALLKLHGAPHDLSSVTVHKIRRGKQRSVKASHQAFLRLLVQNLNGK